MAESRIDNGSSEDRSSVSSKELDSEMESIEACANATAEAIPAAKMEGLEQKSTLEEGIDKLLQSHRSDIMFELRRLTHGDRPVTGQDNRKNVEDFFARNDPEVAASRPVEENRPESVVVEVRGLVESRPVSSILQSSGFRRNLERALRGSLSTFAGRQPPQQTTRTRHEQRPDISRAATNARPTAPQVPSPEMAQAARSIENAQGRRNERGNLTPTSSRSPSSRGNSPGVDRASFVQHLQEIHLRRQQRVEGNAAAPTISFPPAPPLPPVRPEEYAQAWLQGHAQDQRQQEGVSAWDAMEQAQRESIISDISDLVQRQLVTSTLDGEFRNTLEVNMRGRLEASGIDGSRVERVINQLPRIPANMRNNFSDLGIVGHQPGANPDNLSDNISVISATAAVTIPHTQSTAVMSREINSLKSQMQELKNMMKLSFDLQLDIQRAIRQEVSAAIAGALGGESGEGAAAAACASCREQRASSRPVDQSKCVICLDHPADAVLYQCGHLCLCYTCGLTLRQRGSNCPVCRAPIKDIIRAFTAGNTD